MDGRLAGRRAAREHERGVSGLRLREFGQRLNEAQFVCVGRGFEENADVVDANNILARERAWQLCGEPVQSGRSVKQEPAEAI